MTQRFIKFRSVFSVCLLIHSVSMNLIHYICADVKVRSISLIPAASFFNVKIKLKIQVFI